MAASTPTAPAQSGMNVNPNFAATLAGGPGAPAAATPAPVNAPAAAVTAVRAQASAPGTQPGPAPAAQAPLPAHSLFRKILGIGLLALGGGLAGEGTSGPGPAAAAGEAVGIQERQREVQNTQAQARIAQGEQRQMTDAQMAHADIALDALKSRQISRNLTLLPPNRQLDYWQNVGAPLAARLIESGALVPIGESFDSQQEAFAAANELNQNGHTTEYEAIADPEDANGQKFIVVQAQNAPTTRAISIPNPLGGPSFTIPEGVSASQARKSALLAAGLFQRQYLMQFQVTTRATNALNVASIRATAQEERERIKGYSARALSQSLTSIRKSEDSTQAQMTAINKLLSAPGSLLTPAQQETYRTQYTALQQRLGALGVQEQVNEDQLLTMTRGAAGVQSPTPAPGAGTAGVAPGRAPVPNGQPTPPAPASAPSPATPATHSATPFSWTAQPRVGAPGTKRPKGGNE